MDAVRAQAVIQAAGEIYVSTPGGPLPLCSFGPEEMEWLLKTTGQSQELKAARKAAKVMKDIVALDVQLKGLSALRAGSSTILASRTAGTSTARTSTSVRSQQLALVPFIPAQSAFAAAGPAGSVEAERQNRQRAIKKNDGGGPLPAWMHDTMMPYVKFWTRLSRVVVMLPFLFHAVLCLYLILGLVYLVKHPELLVVWGFRCLDLVPEYASYASTRIMEQLAIEVAQRFR